MRRVGITNFEGTISEGAYDQERRRVFKKEVAEFNLKDYQEGMTHRTQKSLVQFLGTCARYSL